MWDLLRTTLEEHRKVHVRVSYWSDSVQYCHACCGNVLHSRPCWYIFGDLVGGEKQEILFSLVAADPEVAWSLTNQDWHNNTWPWACDVLGITATSSWFSCINKRNQEWIKCLWAIKQQEYIIAIYVCCVLLVLLHAMSQHMQHPPPPVQTTANANCTWVLRRNFS